MSKNTNLPKKQSSKKNSPVIAAAISLLIGIIALFASVCLFSFALSGSSDPDAFLPAGAIICACIAGLACGITSAAVYSKPLPISVISAFLILAAFLIISLPFDAVQTENGMIFKTALCLCVVLCSVLSAALRSKKPKRRKSSK